MDTFLDGILFGCGFAAAGLFIALVIFGVMSFTPPRPAGKEAQIYKEVDQ